MSTAVAEPKTPAAAPPLPPADWPNVRGRFGSGWLNRLLALAGTPWRARLARGAVVVPQVRRWEEKYQSAPDEELGHAAKRLRGRARGGEPLDKLLPEAFALMCVASWRVLKMRPFDVQVAGGVILHQGGLAELATGEGKTLTAMMPTFLNALAGKGVHVTTVNDYLAKRDAELVEPAFRLLGVSVGVLQQQMPDDARAAAYKCDVTYGTASEFGFDFLRDRLKMKAASAGGTVPFWAAWTPGAALKTADPRVQRGLHYAIVDEADSVFIDEARTPLIIASPTRLATEEESVVYTWADGVARAMRHLEHFTVDIKKGGKIELTETGRTAVRYSNPPSGEHSHAMDKLHEHVERALQAHYRFQRDKHYMIDDKKKVVIIDEPTGRPMPDRQWRDGLHQAVEAKEAVPINKQTDHAAQITYQNYFRMYRKLAGMSGTAIQNFWELRRVYKLWVVAVPTNKPVRRSRKADDVLPTEDAKFEAVVHEVLRMRDAGRPVLIGTRSVDASERLAARLAAAGVSHSVLNARQNADEAEKVAQAGQPGMVTVATNMAGRGTDIKLGPGVAAAGGLHVIGTERHEAARIDRQLLGRAGRQGDPGSGQFFVSMEDEVLESLGRRRQDSLKRVGRAGGGRDWGVFRRLFLLAQRRTERKHARQRLDMMNADRNRQETLADLGADPFVD